MEKWIGLIGVGMLPGNHTLGEVSGAYVTTLALASDQDGYESVVRLELAKIGLFAFELEDVERFADRCDSVELGDKIHELAERVNPMEPVVFGPFHTYINHDA